jgi:hypothetical protein
MARVHQLRGACCACRRLRELSYVIEVEQLAPRPGRGWDCRRCGLPADGALAAICEECARTRRQIRDVCQSWVWEEGRVARGRLRGRFAHKPAHRRARRRQPAIGGGAEEAEIDLEVVRDLVAANAELLSELLADRSSLRDRMDELDSSSALRVTRVEQAMADHARLLSTSVGVLRGELAAYSEQVDRRIREIMEQIFAQAAVYADQRSAQIGEVLTAVRPDGEDDGENLGKGDEAKLRGACR